MPEVTREEYEAVLIKAKRQAAAVALANRIVKPEGAQRCTLKLEGRDIEMVWFSAKEPDAPLFIGFHGGAFLFGGCALDNAMWTAIRDALGVNIASIGYRQSPEHMWQTCVADAWESVLYLKEHARQLGFDPGRISVIGQSAGGNIAACVALRANETKAVSLKNQVLIYPYLDLSRNSKEKGGPEPGAINMIMDDLHAEPCDRKLPYVSPVYATSEMLKGSPGSVIICAGADELRHEAVKYAEMLDGAGASVHTFCAEGMPHAFFEAGFKTRVSDLEYAFLGPHGKEYFENGSLKRAALEALDFIKKNII